MTLQTATADAAQRLQTLARLYRGGQASDLMDRTLHKLLSYEAEVSRTQLSQLEVDLAEFEQRYGLSSAEFYHRYRAGQTDDRMDYVEWASLIQMADNLRRRLKILAAEDQS